MKMSSAVDITCDFYYRLSNPGSRRAAPRNICSVHAHCAAKETALQQNCSNRFSHFHFYHLIALRRFANGTVDRKTSCYLFTIRVNFFRERTASHPDPFCVREATNQQTTPHSGLPCILNPRPLINRDLPLFVRSAELFFFLFSSGCNWGIPKSRLWVCLTACGQPLFKHSPASAALVCNCG